MQLNSPEIKVSRLDKIAPEIPLNAPHIQFIKMAFTQGIEYERLKDSAIWNAVKENINILRIRLSKAAYELNELKEYGVTQDDLIERLIRGLGVKDRETFFKLLYGEDYKQTPTWPYGADALEKEQDWPGLLTWCRRWTQAEPGDEAAWLVLGFAYGKLSRHQEEIEAYREALRLKPDYDLAWNNLGVAYGKLGRHQEEIEAYREALRLTPDYALAWYNLGLAYTNLGNRSAALEAVKELRRYDPKKAEELSELIAP
jgi:tetratricopeptide (TPR) repeat protein